MNKSKRTKTTNRPKAVWYSTIDKQYGLLYMLANTIAHSYDNSAIEQNRDYPTYVLQRTQSDLKAMGADKCLSRIPSVGSLRIYLNGLRKNVFAENGQGKVAYHNTPSAKKARQKIVNVIAKK
jgi:hypothetical protein